MIVTRAVRSSRRNSIIVYRVENHYKAMSSTAQKLEELLTSAPSLSPLLYHEVLNESHGHNVPRGSETHFKVLVVSPVFEGKLPVHRHRAVYNVVKPLIRNNEGRFKNIYTTLRSFSFYNQLSFLLKLNCCAQFL